MTTTWNADIPAITNQVASDVPDIEENFQLLKDLLEYLLVGTFGTTAHDSFQYDFSAGCTNFASVDDASGNTISLPTNGMSDAVFMLGNSSTIAWFYLNVAPPGWKVLATGADTVLAIAGGSGDYNVNGGNPDSAATWTIDGFSLNTENSHEHSGAAHTHAQNAGSPTSSWTLADYVGAASASNADMRTMSTGGATTQTPLKSGVVSGGSGSTSGNTGHTHTVSQDASYRPAGSVGKLFQLDTA